MNFLTRVSENDRIPQIKISPFGRPWVHTQRLYPPTPLVRFSTEFRNPLPPSPCVRTNWMPPSRKCISILNIDTLEMPLPFYANKSLGASMLHTGCFSLYQRNLKRCHRAIVYKILDPGFVDCKTNLLYAYPSPKAAFTLKVSTLRS